MIIKSVTEKEELGGIKSLHDANLRSVLSEKEREEQGFVSAEYTFDELEEMNKETPAIIAKNKGEVVGYALASSISYGKKHPLLLDLIKKIKAIRHKGISFEDVDFLIIGQLCVHKNYRGQGLVKKLYSFYRTFYKKKYSYCLTDVDVSNLRSLRVHEKMGFETLQTIRYGGQLWKIILWDWTKNKEATF